MKPFHIVALAALAVVLSSSWTAAEIKTETVEYKQGDATLKGFLAYDDAVKEKRPGVLIVHEWWGLNDYPKRRAQDIAKLGYVAFAADMFGDGKTTTDPKEAGQLAGSVKSDPAKELARAQAALDVLKNQPLVDPERIGAMGYCFGGSVVLDMARAGTPFDSVVSFHGALKTSKPAEPGKVKSRLLVLTGDADPLVPPEEVKAFSEEMSKANAPVTIVHYPNAKHAFTNPNADKVGMPPIGYNAEADRQSWEQMKMFWAEVFK